MRCVDEEMIQIVVSMMILCVQRTFCLIVSNATMSWSYDLSEILPTFQNTQFCDTRFFEPESLKLEAATVTIRSTDQKVHDFRPFCLR